MVTKKQDPAAQARRDWHMHQMIMAGGSFGTGQRRGLKRYMQQQLASPAAKACVMPLGMMERAALRVVKRESDLGSTQRGRADADGAGDGGAPSLDPAAAAAAAQVQIIHQQQQELLEKQKAAKRKVQNYKDAMPLAYVFLMKSTPGTTMRDARRYLSHQLEKDPDLSEAFNDMKRYITIVRASIAIAQGLARMPLHDLQEL